MKKLSFCLCALFICCGVGSAHADAKRTLLVHPDEFTDAWIDRAAALGVSGLSLHPVGGAHAVDSLNRLLKDLENPAFRARIDRAKAKGLEVGYEFHAASWLLPRDLFKTHPEYFRMESNGTRSPKLNFCFSNAAALDLVARRAVELAGRLYGSPHRYFFWLDDVNGGACSCERCQKLSESDQQLLYVNRVATELRKTIPDARFCYLAYYGTVAAPRTVRPVPGVFLEFAPYRRDMKKAIALQYEQQLKPLGPLFDLFGRKDARLLEYWYDNSLFSHYRKPPRKLNLDADVIAGDLAVYRTLGFDDIACFACYLGPDYERLWGAPDVSSFSVRKPVPPPVCTVANVSDLEAALAAVTNVPGAPREIVLAAGDYFLARPLALSPAHSNVVLRGAGAGRTVLYGGVPVTGWTKEALSPFWQATLPASAPRQAAFRTLVKDGALAPIARYPGGTNRLEHLGQFKVNIMSSLQGSWQRKPTRAECTTMPYRVVDLPDTMDLPNADIRLYHMWSDSLCTVSNVDRAAHTLWTDQPANWAMGAANRRKYEVLNVREGLTEPGQWYLDRKARTLHYWPKPGEDPAKIRFIAPTLPSVLAVGTGRQRGNRKTWTHNVRLADLSIRAAAPSVAEMASFGGSAITPALRADCVTRLAVENVEIACVGGAGLVIQDAESSRVVNCDIHDTGARGFGVGGWSGCRDNLILSNRVCDVGLVYRGSSGMAVGGSNSVVRANEICRIPYCGVIGGGSDNLYERNYIHHVMQVLHDGGAIYGNLTRCTLRGNVVHDVVPDGKGFGVHAYYADEGSRDCVVENNYAEGVGVPVHNHMTCRTTVRNNTFVFKGDMRISFQRSFDCAFSNNTLVCGGALQVGDPDAVPHWGNNFAVRPRDAKDAASRREIGAWEPARPQQKPKWTLTATRLAAPPTLDGVFGPSEWPLTWVALDRTADRHTSGFTGATIRFAWDDTNLYVSVMAAAFKSSRLSLGSTWGRDDGIELVLAGGRRLRAYFSGQTEIVPAAFAAGGVRVWAGRDPGIRHAWENQNKAHYEIAIPWSALGLVPKKGLTIPFNACAYMSEFNQYKYWEGTAAAPGQRPADAPPGRVALGGF